MINATDIAENIASATTNMIMQSAFFKRQRHPLDDAVKYMKDAIDQTYGRKGDEVVEMNYKVVDEA